MAGSPNDNVTEFDPPIGIGPDGSFFSSGPLPPPLDAILTTFEGTFDFAAVPATVSGMLTIGMVAAPSTILCTATFTAGGPSPDTDGELLPTPSPPPTDTPAATPTPGGPSATATPDDTPAATPTPVEPAATATPDDTSEVLETAVSPSLPETGAGALAAERGAGAGLWALIGVLLATAAVALAFSGWRYIRTP